MVPGQEAFPKCTMPASKEQDTVWNMKANLKSVSSSLPPSYPPSLHPSVYSSLRGKICKTYPSCRRRLCPSCMALAMYPLYVGSEGGASTNLHSCMVKFVRPTNSFLSPWPFQHPTWCLCTASFLFWAILVMLKGIILIIYICTHIRGSCKLLIVNVCYISLVKLIQRRFKHEPIQQTNVFSQSRCHNSSTQILYF